MKAKTIIDVAAIARERRKHLGWSQSNLADASGVGRDWIIQFEKGKPTIEWGLVMRVLRELGLSMDLQISEPGQENGSHDLNAILSSTLKPRPNQ